MDGYGYVNDYYDDDDGDDDDDEIAPDAKVSFFSVLWMPGTMFFPRFLTGRSGCSCDNKPSSCARVALCQLSAELPCKVKI